MMRSGRHIGSSPEAARSKSLLTGSLTFLERSSVSSSIVNVRGDAVRLEKVLVDCRVGFFALKSQSAQIPGA